MTKNQKLVYGIVNALIGFMSIWGVLLFRNIIPLLIAIPLFVYLSKNKPKDPKAKEEFEMIGAKSYAYGILFPVLLILFLFACLIFWKVFPAIY